MDQDSQAMPGCMVAIIAGILAIVLMQFSEGLGAITFLIAIGGAIYAGVKLEADKSPSRLSKELINENSAKFSENCKEAGFKANIKLSRPEEGFYLGYDDEGFRILALTPFSRPNTPLLVDLKTVLKIDLCVDGQSIYSSQFGETLGGAALGGIMFGGSGAVVGALAGQAASSLKLPAISIKLKLDDLSSPSADLIFNREAIPVRKEKKEQVLELAENWVSFIEVLLHRMGQSTPPNNSN